MQRLIFELIQHTPIIHFQAKDMGATLRASEVKPKLDKFILKEYKKECKEKLPKSVFRDREEDKGKREGKEIRKSLDYKMWFIADKVHYDSKNAPMYFGNIRTKKPKLLVTAESVKMIILVKDDTLKYYIEKFIVRFFQLYNFGARQSKGYGSFTIKDRGTEGIRGVYDYSFNVSSRDYQEVMNRINYFYKSLRSGINEYRGRGVEKRNILYFKSALHYYVTTDRNEQWDKKSIKEHFLPQQLASEETMHRAEDISSKEKYDFRDLLGFSANEAWGSQFRIIKTCEKKADKEVEEFSRLKSPIQFKPIRFKDGFTVFFDVFPESSGWNDFLGSEVCVNAFYEEGTLSSKPSLTLKVPTDIDLKKVLRYIFSTINLQQRKSIQRGEREGERIFNGINAIYDELRKKKK